MNIIFRIIFFTLYVTCCVFAADHETFKNCSRVDFCNQLRNRIPSDDYSLDPSTVTINLDGNTIQAILKAQTQNPDLLLTLTALYHISFRLKITEINSTRYELQDVIEEDPPTINVDTIISSSEKVIVSAKFITAILYSFPFKIEFINSGILQVVFNGNQLSLEQNGSSAPFSFGLTFPEAIQLYGLHQHCDTLALKNTSLNNIDPYRLKNSDLAYYETESPMALYGAVPALYGLSPNASAGVFLHNAAEQWVDTTSNPSGNSTAYFMVETGTLDLFVLLGPTLQEVIRQYTNLTGTAPLPPVWSLGYHQSRYSYGSQDEVKELATNFDSNNFQLDAVWLDIDYTDEYKYFTWNPSNFSNPKEMQDFLASTNKKLVTIIDPHIKVEQGYNVYDEALKNEFFVKNSNGTVFQGDCWPGLSSYIDFLNPDARNYYADQYSYDNFPNTTSTLAGIWNDMNEPSVFDTSLEMTLPADSLHIGNVKHREIHNIYGHLHSMATYQGLKKRDNFERRPFVLTRSHFAGSQKYAAHWTGDNQADWAYLKAAFQMCLNANLMGLVFCGADIGGFFNNPSMELLERWYQAAAWLPFFRAHATKDSVRREPYLLPEDSQDIVKRAIQIRYQYITHWYTLFYEHSVSGDPIIRPIFYQYPEEIEAYGIDTQFLVGRNLLIGAVTQPNVSELNFYFPGGYDEIWVSMIGSDVKRGVGFANTTIRRELYPFFLRFGGAVVSQFSTALNTAELSSGQYVLLYTINRDLQAFGSIYLDDGISFKYQNFSDFNYNEIEVNGEAVTFTPIAGDGNYEIVISRMIRKEIVELPRNSKPGVCKEKVYEKTREGELLENIKIKLNQKTTIHL